MKFILTTLLVLAFPLMVKCQIKMLSIDSLYLQGVSKFYQFAETTKDEIWPGMELSPVCLYRVDGPAILYNHPNPPASFKKIDEKTHFGLQNELNLFGATQVKINGVLTAIVNYGLEHYSRPEEVYAELFHEVHHVFQRNSIKNIESDNPAILLNYPEDINNDAIKLFEQQLLLKMAFTNDKNQFNKYLNQFYSSRIKRGNIIGEKYIKYEKTVENFEGPAYYCEYRFYNSYSSHGKTLKENYSNKHFWSILNTPYYGRNNLRLRHLASGLAMCYILDRFISDDWKNEYYSGNTDLFDFFVLKFKPHVVDLPDFDVFYSLSDYHTTRLILQREQDYELFLNKSGIKVILEFESTPQFRGFDPMSSKAINDSIILHSSYLSLNNKDNSLFVKNNEVATIINQQIWFVSKVIFFLERESDLIINGEKIIISKAGLDLKWEGKIIADEKNKIKIKLK